MDLDKRKARIVAALRPTRKHRGVRTASETEELARRFAASARELYRWETGSALPEDHQLPGIEAWLAEGPVWRYAAIDRVVGPEVWIPLSVGPPPARKRLPLSTDIRLGAGVPVRGGA